MNKVLLTGRLVRDPDVRYTQGQEQMCTARFTVAVNRMFKKDGAQTADFIACVAFGKIGEFAENYAKKGVKFEIEGHWQTGSYEKDGHKIYTNNCVVERMEFAESKKDDSQTQTQPQPEPSPVGDGFMSIPDGIDEELPFN